MEIQSHLLVPLPLAELLHVCLGAVTEVLEDEDHRWVPLIRTVLATYQQGRDDIVTNMYGEHITSEIDIITHMVAEELCKWSSEMAEESTDFERWAEELGRDNETGSKD